jgi:hypothetical protein
MTTKSRCLLFIAGIGFLIFGMWVMVGGAVLDAGRHLVMAAVLIARGATGDRP